MLTICLGNVLLNYNRINIWQHLEWKGSKCVNKRPLTKNVVSSNRRCKQVTSKKTFHCVLQDFIMKKPLFFNVDNLIDSFYESMLMRTI